MNNEKRSTKHKAQKKKILFLVPDGVGIRSYLFSRVVKQLVDLGHEVIIWHTLSEDALQEVEEVHGITLHTEKLPPYKESVREKFLREAVSYARLRYNTKLSSNQTIMTNWAPSRVRWRNRLFYMAVERAGMMLHSYDSILRVEQKHTSAVGGSQYLQAFSDFLVRYKPDVVFNAHQRAINAIPAFIAAQKLGIKTVTAIYSWDNLPKARLNTKADTYFVWSNYMKRELHTFYPEVHDSDILVTGTPQFDFYHDASLYMTKEAFCRRFGLDPKRKTVCFSGDDERTSPYDPDYLEDLAKAVSTMRPEIRPQILFRRCPVDLSGRYDNVLSKYKEVIKVADPLWKRDRENDGWMSVYPSFEDAKLLVNIALHCDAVYNIGSTMALDFAVFDKPALYINYDRHEDRNWSVHTIYKFQHFRSMQGLDTVVWVNRKEDIGTTLARVLQEPERCATERKKWLELITGATETNITIAEKIADSLTKV